MARKLSLKLNFNFSVVQEKLFGQFRDLDPKDPAKWPTLPRYALFVALAVLVLVVLWFVWLSDTADELGTQRAQEVKLRDEYKVKLGKAVNLEVLKKQREQVQQYV